MVSGLKNMINGTEQSWTKEAEILNCGLSLAMEWGENWLKPIQSRLAKEYPTLSPHELDNMNTICQTAMRFGHNLIYSVEKTNNHEVNQTEWQTKLLHRYPWINKANLGRLFSQSMYYAWK